MPSRSAAGRRSRGKAVLEATGETFADAYARRNAEIDRLADLALEDAA